MTDKELDTIWDRLLSRRNQKKDVALAKAQAEIQTIQREFDAYHDGVYDALKEIRTAMMTQEKTP